MLGIRTDANKIAATGHVMRCMTIADEVKKLEAAGATVVEMSKS